MSVLNDRDLAVLKYIEETYRHTGFTPSYRDIRDWYGGGCNSTSGVSRVMDRLEEAGYLIFNEARKIYIPSRWRELSSESNEKRVESLKKENEILKRQNDHMMDIAVSHSPLLRSLKNRIEQLQVQNDWLTKQATTYTLTQPVQIMVTAESFERLSNAAGKVEQL